MGREVRVGDKVRFRYRNAMSMGKPYYQYGVVAPIGSEEYSDRYSIITVNGIYGLPRSGFRVVKEVATEGSGAFPSERTINQTWPSHWPRPPQYANLRKEQ